MQTRVGAKVLKINLWQSNYVYRTPQHHSSRTTIYALLTTWTETNFSGTAL